LCRLICFTMFTGKITLNTGKSLHGKITLNTGTV
jgi:hypothetical protein